MTELTGTTSVNVFVDLVSGTLGTVGTGSNWSNARAFITDLGGGWRGVSIVARKTNAATSIRTYIGAATANVTPSYAGSAALHAISIWRATLAQSSVPVRLTLTTDTVTTGTTQTSNRLHLKGLPASTQNLLKAGDMVQIGGQINRLIAPLNSDAGGRGVLICGNPWRSPSDNAPVIVNTPMCKMMIATDMLEIETMAAQFSGFTLELEEVIE
jgi:hypothetical protein